MLTWNVTPLEIISYQLKCERNLNMLCYKSFQFQFSSIIRFEEMDPNSYIFSGEEVTPIYHPNITVGQILINCLRKTPNKVTQICIDEREFTCGELEQLSIRAAQNLQNYGIKLEDVTCIITNNATYSIPIVIACTMIGSPLLILSPDSENKEIAHLLKLAAPKLIFCDDFVVDKILKIVSENNILGKLVSLIKKMQGLDYVQDFLKETGNEDNFV